MSFESIVARNKMSVSRKGLHENASKNLWFTQKWATSSCLALRLVLSLKKKEDFTKISGIPIEHKYLKKSRYPEWLAYVTTDTNFIGDTIQSHPILILYFPNLIIRHRSFRKQETKTLMQIWVTKYANMSDQDRISLHNINTISTR